MSYVLERDCPGMACDSAALHLPVAHGERRPRFIVWVTIIHYGSSPNHIDLKYQQQSRARTHHTPVHSGQPSRIHMKWPDATNCTPCTIRITY